MIYEFALEPELVATWHDNNNYSFFHEKFSVKTGRIISGYPKDWQKKVWQAFDESTAKDDDNARMKLGALLDNLKHHMSKRRGTFGEIKIWQERAEAEHEMRPFHAILSRQNPRKKDFVISAHDLVSELDHPQWKVPDIPPTVRNAQQMLNAVAPILRLSKSIQLIDPYFDPNKNRFMKPLEAFLYEIWNNRYGPENPDVELHTSVKRYLDPQGKGQCRDLNEQGRVTYELKNNILQKLPRIIPPMTCLHVKIWKEKEREIRKKLHNRYILTELCGIFWGHGLDQDNIEDTIDTDDVEILSTLRHEERLKDYSGNPGAFDFATPPFSVVGKT